MAGLAAELSELQAKIQPAQREVKNGGKNLLESAGLEKPGLKKTSPVGFFGFKLKIWKNLKKTKK